MGVLWGYWVFRWVFGRLISGPHKCWSFWWCLANLKICLLNSRYQRKLALSRIFFILWDHMSKVATGRSACNATAYHRIYDVHGVVIWCDLWFLPCHTKPCRRLRLSQVFVDVSLTRGVLDGTRVFEPNIQWHYKTHRQHKQSVKSNIYERLCWSDPAWTDISDTQWLWGCRSCSNTA